MSSTALKLLALLLMVIDHIGEFIPGMNIRLHYIGRLSYPMFLFCMLWSLSYTHDRISYFKRLYAAGAVMAVIDLILNQLFKPPYHYMMNDIFVSLLLTAVLIHIAELLRVSTAAGVRWLLCFIAFQAASIWLCNRLDGSFGLACVGQFIGALLPNVVWCEGGYYFIIMGFVLYFLKESRWKFSIAFILFSLYYILLCYPEFRYEDIMWHRYQWMQVFALPFLLLYNHRRGAGMKRFFYVFYPAHLVLLFLLGNCL